MKRMGAYLTKHRLNEIFANVKKDSENKEEDTLDIEEFEEALSYLDIKNRTSTL